MAAVGPTPQDHERALNPKREANIRKWIADGAAAIGVCALMEEVDHLRTALAEQRERDADAMEAAGERHHDLTGDDVPRRLASIAAAYLRSGYDAAAIRRGE